MAACTWRREVGERHSGVRAPLGSNNTPDYTGRLTIVQMFQEIMKDLP